MSMPRRSALLILCLALVYGHASAGAEERIMHGQDITAEVVGPAAAGITNLNDYDGAILKDGGSYSFARRIETAATYDGFAVPGPHLLITGAAFSGGLDIYTKLPVVLRGAVVRPKADGLWAIHTRPGAGPLFVLWSDLGGGPGARVNVALMLRAGHATLYRSHISNALDGVRITASGHRITETLIDDLVTRPKDHNDGIQTSPEAQDVVIERSRIMNRNPQTSCVLIRGNDIAIRDSYLAGGGWVIYGGRNGNGHGGKSSTGLEISGTIFGRDFFARSGHFGPVTYWGKGNAWSANRFDDGRAIAPAKKGSVCVECCDPAWTFTFLGERPGTSLTGTASPYSPPQRGGGRGGERQQNGCCR